MMCFAGLSRVSAESGGDFLPYLEIQLSLELSAGDKKRDLSSRHLLPQGLPHPGKGSGRRARTPCREAAGPGARSCSLLIPFPPAGLRLREWLSQDLPCFRARALVFTRLRCIVCLQAASRGASVLRTFIWRPAGSGRAVLPGSRAPCTPFPASCEPEGSLSLNEKFSERSGASRKMLCSSVCAGWRRGWAGG